MDLKWESRYSIGVDRIDEEHRTLFGILSDLGTAMEHNAEREEILVILGRLAEYTRYHFDSEEQLMLSHNYPAYREHKRAHELLKRRLAELILHLKNKGTPITEQTFSAMREWILAHVSSHTHRDDLELGKYLAEQNEADLKPPPGPPAA